MLDSFGRGFKMIWASIKMGWLEKRLLLPSILTVLTNIFFACLIAYLGATKLKEPGDTGAVAAHHAPVNLLSAAASHHRITDLTNLTGLNGPTDQSGMGALGLPDFNSHTAWLIFGLMVIWWITNRFLEGVTTALVYTHLTEGPGAGRFSEAVGAVFASLPAIIVLGIVTFIARKLAGLLRRQRGSGMMGFGMGFLAGIVDIFWTLAGHLILPAIVIEGTSFWGALKRADRIAQGNLLTIGVGEVGVDAICKATSFLLYAGGVAGFGYAFYTHVPLMSAMVIGGAFAWAMTVVVVTALSIYIRAGFYTCLYVWALDAEAVHEAERSQIRPPAPLAAALS
jgi:hypothetical protein